MNLRYLLSVILIPFMFVSAAGSQSSTENKNTASEFQQTKSDQPNLSIQSLLQQFVRNGSNQLFDGTFVYFFEDKVQTVKVHREKNAKGDVVEEFVPMDGKQKKTSRVLDNQYCSLNNDWQYQFQSTSSSFPFRINNYYQQLQHHYHFSLSGIETVAGIPAVGLLIKSKDPYRYGYELWFEPQTATLLKYKLMDQKANVIEQYFFTDITINKDSVATNFINIADLSSPCQQQFQGMTKAFQQYFTKNKIPAGYEPVSFRKAYINDSERQAYQFQLSDGLSTVSIFIEDSKQSNKPINGVIKLGPVNVAGKTLEKHQVTVIGVIPIVSALGFIKAIKKTDLN